MYSLENFFHLYSLDNTLWRRFTIFSLLLMISSNHGLNTKFYSARHMWLTVGYYLVEKKTHSQSTGAPAAPRLQQVQTLGANYIYQVNILVISIMAELEALKAKDTLHTSTGPMDEKQVYVGDLSKQPIRTRYLGHGTGYQPIRNQNFFVRSDPDWSVWQRKED